LTINGKIYIILKCILFAYLETVYHYKFVLKEGAMYMRSLQNVDFILFSRLVKNDFKFWKPLGVKFVW